MAKVQELTVEVIADLEDGDDYGEEIVDDDWWEEVNLPTPKADSKRVEHLKLFGDRLDVFYALLAVADLRFYQLDVATQQKLIRNLQVETFHAGDIIIKEGQDASAFYIILATNEFNIDAEVEVYKKLEDGSEKVLTSLSRGHYFGEKTFVSNNPQPRNASIRVPSSCEVGVPIGIVKSEYYSDWDHFRQFLVMKDVPLIKSLPRHEQLEMYSKLTRMVYQSEDFIIKEGDPGEDFFIVLEGVVRVQDALHGVLVSLQAGHCFGEMALLSDEPRVASVVAQGKVICLCLSKAAFRAALSAEKFSAIVNDVMEQRRLTRLKRDREREKLAMAISSRKGSVSSANMSEDEFPELEKELWAPDGESNISHRGRSSKSNASSGAEVTFSSKLVIKKVGHTKYINRYRVVKEIGKGSFGSVYMVVDERNNENCAMKAVNRSTGWNSKVDIMSEIEIMKHLNHKNLVSLKGVIDDLTAQKMFIVQELVGGGCLMNDEMTASGNNNAPVPFSDALSRKYFRDMVKGVHYLHSLGIIHRDIKPQNVLLTNEGQCKLSDFGSAISVHSKSNKKLAVAGTPAFMAPELFIDPTPDNQKAPAIDIFALGATLYCMVLGKVPWMAKNEIDLSAQITKFEVTFPVDSHLDPHLKHLLINMMEKDLLNRLDLNSIISHDWVTCESSEPMYDDFERIPRRCPLFRQASNAMHNRSFSNGSSGTVSSSPAPTSLGSGMSGVIYPTSQSEKSSTSSLSILSSITAGTGYVGPSSALSRGKSSSYAGGKILNHTYDEDDGEMDISQSLARDLDRLQERNTTNPRGSTARLVPAMGGTGMRLASPDHDDMGSATSTSSGPSVIYYGVDDILDVATSMHAPPLQGAAGLHAISELEGEEDTDEDHSPLKGEHGAVSNSGVGGSGTPGTPDVSSKSANASMRKILGKQPSLKRTGGFEIIPTEITISATGEKISKGIVLETTASESLASSSFYAANMRRINSRAASLEPNPTETDGESHVLGGAKMSGGSSQCGSDNFWTDVASVAPGKEAWGFDGIREEDGNELDVDSSDSSDDSEVADGDMVDITDVGLDSMFDMAPNSRAGKDSDDGLCWQPLSDMEIGDHQKLTAKLRHCGMYCGSDCVNETLGIRCGSALDKGGRHYMEDKVFAHVSMDNVVSPADGSHELSDLNSCSTTVTGVRMSLQNPEVISFFGVLDGHNGDYVAEKLQTSTPQVLLQVLLGEVMRYSHINYQNSPKKLSRMDTTESSNSVQSPQHSVQSLSSPAMGLSPLRTKKKGFGFKKMFSFSSSHVTPPKMAIIGDGTSGFFSIPPSYINQVRPGVETARDCLFKQCLLDCCALVDREIVEFDFGRQERLLQAGRDGNAAGGNILNTHFAGCVGTMVVIVDTGAGLDINYQFPTAHPSMSTSSSAARTTSNIRGERKMFLANVGDCRTVLSDAGVAVQLTTDHKPDLPGEKSRVEAAGGFVHKGRVNGVLAVSRSFGDIMYRNYVPHGEGKSVHLSPSSYASAETAPQHPSCAEEQEPDGLWNPTTQPVIAKPDIYEYLITDSAEFIIMASDGLWDVIKSQEAVNFVRRQLYEHCTIERAAQELLAKAIEKGSSDNISVQIVCLNQQEGGSVALNSTSHTLKSRDKVGRKRTGPQCTTQ